MRLSVSHSFEAAHRLPLYKGPCFDLHGHGYKFNVTVEAKTDPKTGMGPDFLEIQRKVKELVFRAVDHKYLNDFIDNPTAENIVKWMWRRLDSEIPGLFEIALWETPDCWAAYRGDEEVRPKRRGKRK